MIYCFCNVSLSYLFFQVSSQITILGTFYHVTAFASSFEMIYFSLIFMFFITFIYLCFHDDLFLHLGITLTRTLWIQLIYDIISFFASYMYTIHCDHVHPLLPALKTWLNPVGLLLFLTSLFSTVMSSFNDPLIVPSLCHCMFPIDSFLSHF